MSTIRPDAEREKRILLTTGPQRRIWYSAKGYVKKSDLIAIINDKSLFCETLMMCRQWDDESILEELSNKRIKYSKKVFEDLAHLGRNPDDLCEYIRQCYFPEFPKDFDMEFVNNYKSKLKEQIEKDMEELDKYIDEKVNKIQQMLTASNPPADDFIEDIDCDNTDSICIVSIKLLIAHLTPLEMSIHMNDTFNLSIMKLIANEVLLTYKGGMSIKAMEAIDKLRFEAKTLTRYQSFQSRNNSICRYVGVPINCVKMVTCSVCGKISFGCLIFCPYCTEKHSRRLQGCKVRNCLANNSKWNGMKEEERNCVTGKETCTHCRTSSPQCVISETPLSHIITLTNLKMDDRFLFSTPQELNDLVEECIKQGRPCPLVTKTIANCLYAFGEVELATKMFRFLQASDDPSTIRGSLYQGAELFSHDDSIESISINWSHDEYNRENEIRKELKKMAEEKVSGPKDHGNKVTEKQRVLIEETNKKIDEEFRRLTLTRYGCPESIKNLTLFFTNESSIQDIRKSYNKDRLRKNGIHGGRKFDLDCSFNLLEKQWNAASAEKEQLNNASVFVKGLKEVCTQKDSDERRVIKEDDLKSWEEFYGSDFDQTTRFHSFSGHSNYISFEPPGPRISYEKRYIFYRLRFDGVEASANSLQCNTYDVVTLEVINCHERDRESGIMTINGLLLSKENIGRVHHHIDEFIKEVTITGINGVFVKSRKQNQWYYYRWAIAMVVCDTVAQEELIGRLGAKQSSFPCIYSKYCKACRFNAETFSFTELNAPSPLTGKRGFKVVGLFLDQLHPNSFYRCPGFVYHIGLDETLIYDYADSHNYVISEQHRNEITSLTLLLSKFGSLLHQWWPTCISCKESYIIRIHECRSLFLSEEEEDYSNRDNNEEQDFSHLQGLSDDENDEDDEDDEDDEGKDANNAEVHEDTDTDQPRTAVETEMDEQDQDDPDYDEDMPDDTPFTNSIDATSNPVIPIRLSLPLESYENHLDEMLESLDVKTKKNLKKFIAKMDSKARSSTDLTRNMIPQEFDRHGVDAQHNLANIMMWLIRVFSNLIPTKTAKANTLFLDSWTKYMIYGEKSSEMLSYTLFPDFAPIREKAISRLEAFLNYGDLPPSISWITKDILSLKFFKKISNHNKILFFFSLFVYAFQDSLYKPCMFFIKNILDHLAYFYNANGSISEFAKVQANFDVFCGLLEGELGLGYTNYSLHNAQHYFKTYVCGGSICLNSCFVSERSYSLHKNSVSKGAKPELAAGKKVHFYQNANLVSESFEPYPKSPILNNPIDKRTSVNQAIVSLLKETYNAFYTFSVINLLDDITHEKDCMLTQDTLVDQVLSNEYSLGYQGLPELLKTYSKDHNYYLDDISIERKENIEVFSSCEGIVDIGHPKADSIKSHQIAFTRLYDGSIRLFIVLGFVSMTMNNKSYVQALCLPIKTMSGSSWLNTLHYGFIRNAEFERCFRDLSIVPVSICRLNFKKCGVIPYDDNLLYFMIFKLSIFQWRVCNYDFLHSIKRYRKRERDVYTCFYQTY